MSSEFVGQAGIEGAVATLTQILAGPMASGSKLRLYKDSFTPGPMSKNADFVANEVAFTGYVSVALTWSAVGITAVSVAQSVSNRAFFQATDAVAPASVGGCWIDETIPGTPPTDESVAWFPFNPSVPMNAALDFLAVVILLTLPGWPGTAIVDS